MTDKQVQVDEHVVKEWAEGTLLEWFTGYTHDPDHPQYKITHVGEEIFEVSGTYPNTSVVPKRFRVQVSVSEV